MNCEIQRDRDARYHLYKFCHPKWISLSICEIYGIKFIDGFTVYKNFWSLCYPIDYLIVSIAYYVMRRLVFFFNLQIYFFIVFLSSWIQSIQYFAINCPAVNNIAAKNPPSSTINTNINIVGERFLKTKFSAWFSEKQDDFNQCRFNVVCDVELIGAYWI